MGFQRWISCDGPTCNVNVPFLESQSAVELIAEQHGILPNRAPKDWLAIEVKIWRQVDETARVLLGGGNPDNTRYFCSPRCLTLFSLAWWQGEAAVLHNLISLQIRRLATDHALDPHL